MGLIASHPAPIFEVGTPGALPAALAAFGLTAGRPVLVSVGGASGLAAPVAEELGALFRERLAPLLDRLRAVVLDGGTDAGIMALMGRARRDAGAGFPLLGIAPRGTVVLPGEHRRGGVALEPNHSHLLLVPGSDWGDEIPWMCRLATLISGTRASAMLVSGGGRVTARDVEAGLAAGRPALLLCATGGVADRLAHEVQAGLASGSVPDPLLRVVPAADRWSALPDMLARLLAAPDPRPLEGRGAVQAG